MTDLISLLPGGDLGEDADFEIVDMRLLGLAADLETCGDRTLIPQLEAQLVRCFDDEDFGGRNIIAAILAGIAGADALVALLDAVTADRGDRRSHTCARLDSKGALEVIVDTVLTLVGADDPDPRLTGLWALPDGQVGGQ